MQVTVKDSPKSIDHTKVRPVPKIETLDDTLELIEDPKVEPLTAFHNTDNNTVEITLKTGEDLTMREPRGKDFLEAEAWISQVAEERRSESFLILRLALICSTFRMNDKLIPKPKFEEFLDLLDDYESMEKIVLAIGFFRISLTDYFERLQERAKKMGMELPEQTV